MFYLLNKPSGISSFKAIKKFAQENNISKIGHTGTLDPLASGLLLVATEADTKLIDYIDKGFKTYQTTMKLGYVSDTYDSQGVVQVVNKFIPNEAQVKTMIKSYEKQYWQIPPHFSAKKVNGKKAYDWALAGKTVALKPTLVTIKKIAKIQKHDYNTYSFETVVSRGTYIRSLIHDIGTDLQCGAIMSQLSRTKIGDFTLVDRPTKVDIKDLLILDVIQFEDISDLEHGKIIATNYSDGTYAVRWHQAIVGVVIVSNKTMKVKKMLGTKIATLKKEKFKNQ